MEGQGAGRYKMQMGTRDRTFQISKLFLPKLVSFALELVQLLGSRSDRWFEGSLVQRVVDMKRVVGPKMFESRWSDV